MAVWAKVMTSLRDHPKAVEAGHQSMWMYVTMILFCKERDTCGFVPASFVSTSCHGRAPLRAVSRLVDVGLVHEVDGGWEVVQYAEKQGESASLSQMRDKKAAQKRKERATKPGNVASDSVASVASLEQSRAEQSRDTSPNGEVHRTRADEVLHSLETIWPEYLCRPFDSRQRHDAVIGSFKEIPPDIADAAARYLDANDFTGKKPKGCPSLHRWIAEKRWTEDLPQSKPKSKPSDFAQYDAGIIGGAA